MITTDSAKLERIRNICIAAKTAPSVGRTLAKFKIIAEIVGVDMGWPERATEDPGGGDHDDADLPADYPGEIG